MLPTKNIFNLYFQDRIFLGIYVGYTFTDMPWQKKNLYNNNTIIVFCTSILCALQTTLHYVML